MDCGEQKSWYHHQKRRVAERLSRQVSERERKGEGPMRREKTPEEERDAGTLWEHITGEGEPQGHRAGGRKSPREGR